MRHRVAALLRIVSLLLASLSLPACAPPERVLLLITVDTLRADHLGAYGAEGDLTPHLDALAAGSLRFDAAYAPVAFTLPSVGAVFTGLIPDQSGLSGNRSRLPDEIPTLATLLRERGWRTGAVVSNYVLRQGTGLGRGFEIYDEEMQESEAVRGVAERTAGNTTDAALAVFDRLRGNADGESGGDVFLWVHYQDPHGPYTPPEGYRERFLETVDGASQPLAVNRDTRGQGGIPSYQFLEGRRDAAFYLAGYDGEVRYADEQIGRLLEGLRQRGALDDAVVVFTADHGEGMGERDYWFAHGEQLTDGQVRVPLLIRAPGVAPGVREDVVGLVDLLPTLLGLLDVEARTGSRGRDLLAEDAAEGSTEVVILGSAPANRLGFVYGDYKLILTPEGGDWATELYRRGEEEPDQERSASQPTLTRRMKTRVLELRNSLKRRTPQARQELDASDLERLRALGYVEEDEPVGEVTAEMARLLAAVRDAPNDAAAHNNLANALSNAGRPEEALEHFRKAVALQPGYYQAHSNFALALTKAGRPGEALVEADRALAIEPRFAQAHNARAIALADLGRGEEAAASYREALALMPGWPPATRRLAWLRATSPDPAVRDGAEAVRLATAASQRTGNRDPQMLDTLAAAQAEAGDFEAAAATAERALAAARGAGDDVLADAIRSRLALYREGVPYREEPRGEPPSGEEPPAGAAAPG